MRSVVFRLIRQSSQFPVVRLPSYGYHCSSQRGQEHRQPASMLFLSGRQCQLTNFTVNPHLDLQDIIERWPDFKRNCQDRNIDVSDKLISEIEVLRNKRQAQAVLAAQRNSLREEVKQRGRENTEDLLTPLSRIKEEVKLLTEKMWDAEEVTIPKVLGLPNNLHTRTPTEDTVVHCHNPTPHPRFPSKSHTDLGKKSALLKLAPFGLNAYYLRGPLAALELAIVEHFSHCMRDAGFRQVSCPDFYKAVVVEGCGRNPLKCTDTLQLASDNVYEQSVHLTGSASLESFSALLTRISVQKNSLPICHFTVGRNYRIPSGSSEQLGLYAATQLTTVSCFSATNTDGIEDIFDQLVTAFSSCYSVLDIPFRIKVVCASQLHKSESCRIQFELWSPYFSSYFPSGSLVLYGDYLGKRLQMVYTNGSEKAFLHSLAGTAVLAPVMIASIMENFQNVDGTFRVPPTLERYMNDVAVPV